MPANRLQLYLFSRSFTRLPRFFPKNILKPFTPSVRRFPVRDDDPLGPPGARRLLADYYIDETFDLQGLFTLSITLFRRLVPRFRVQPATGHPHSTIRLFGHPIFLRWQIRCKAVSPLPSEGGPTSDDRSCYRTRLLFF